MKLSNYLSKETLATMSNVAKEELCKKFADYCKNSGCDENALTIFAISESDVDGFCVVENIQFAKFSVLIPTTPMDAVINYMMGASSNEIIEMDTYDFTHTVSEVNMEGKMMYYKIVELCSLFLTLCYGENEDRLKSLHIPSNPVDYDKLHTLLEGFVDDIIMNSSIKIKDCYFKMFMGKHRSNGTSRVRKNADFIGMLVNVSDIFDNKGAVDKDKAVATLTALILRGVYKSVFTRVETVSLSSAKNILCSMAVDALAEMCYKEYGDEAEEFIEETLFRNIMYNKDASIIQTDTKGHKATIQFKEDEDGCLRAELSVGGLEGHSKNIDYDMKTGRIYRMVI